MKPITLALAPALVLAILLLCGSPSRMLAQANTKIVIKDGGSLIFSADGLDARNTWTITADEIRHGNSNLVLTSLQIADGDNLRCKNPRACGANPAKPWKIRIAYAAGAVTLASLSSNAGVHLTHNQLPFDKWQHTTNADEREFGHGDGRRIASITVNGGANLCSGHGCQVTLSFSPR
jgi:hypothetical protein